MKLFLLLFTLVSNLAFSQTMYEKDFEEFLNDVSNNYAYLDKQNINPAKIKEYYKSEIAKIASNIEFISFLEKVINEFYNGHISLNTNLSSSNRIIPSGSDILIKKINGKYMVTDLRRDFKSEKSGLKIGMEISKFNDQKIDQQLNKFLPRTQDKITEEMFQYALNMLFAGTHNIPRKFTIIENGLEREYFPDNYQIPTPTENLIFSKLSENIGYIKINNSLGNYHLINDFDKALDSLLNKKTLVLDLTETPGGGNTTVARAILGRFTNKTIPYQKHEFDEKQFATKRVWTEYVVPRKKIYKGNIYIITGNWTGSMGEGLAIAFDNLKNAKTIGTKMAGLLGAISGFKLQESGIGFQIPTERLYHINGTPREEYLPQIQTKNVYDTWNYLRKKLKFK